MGHFVKVLDGIVVRGIVAEPEFFDTFIDDSPGEWIQTSYNTHGGKHPENRPLRKNFACIGYTYDKVRDAFIPPKPYESWILDEETCLWEPPVEMPILTEEEISLKKYYRWDEDAYQVDNTTGWVLITP